MGVYIYQFGFLQPIASIVNSQVPIAIFTAGLLFLALIVNRLNFKKTVIIVFLVTGIYFLFHSMVYTNNTLIIIPNLYLEFLMKGFSAFYIGSLDIKSEKLYSVFLKLGIVNLIAIGAYPFTNFLDSMNYMRFGYAMLPSVMIFLFAFLDNKKNILRLGLLVYSLIITVIYGSRGPLLSLIFLALLLFLFNVRYRFKIKTYVTLVGAIVLFFAVKYNFISKIVNYMYFDLGITNYTIMKFQRALHGDFWGASSGRDRIYLTTWEYIKESPLFGHGMGFSYTISGSSTHNILLQILSETGILGLIIWMFIGLTCIKKYRLIAYENKKVFRIVSIIVAIFIGRLSISSDMWLRPEFWFGISMLLNYKTNEVNIKKLSY